MLHAYRRYILQTTVTRCTPANKPVLVRCFCSSSSAPAIDMASGIKAGDLRERSCSLLGGCSSDTPRVSYEQVPQYLAALPAWQLAVDKCSISKSFVAKNFVAAVKFFNRVAELAEVEGHHPDLHLTNYREVQVVLSTHAVGGLTIFDFIMAAKIDAVEVEYSPKWLKQNQHAVGATAHQTPAS